MCVTQDTSIQLLTMSPPLIVCTLCQAITEKMKSFWNQDAIPSIKSLLLGIAENAPRPCPTPAFSFTFLPFFGFR